MDRLTIKQHKLNRIIKYYAMTSLILTLMLPTLITGVIYVQRRDAILSEMAQVTRTLGAAIVERENEANRLAQILTATNAWEAELIRYFDLTYSQHWTYYLVNKAQPPFLPKEIHRQYRYNPYLQAIQIVLDGRDQVYESLVDNPYGRKVEVMTGLEGIHIVESLRSLSSFSTIGQLIMTYNFADLAGNLKNEMEGSLVYYDGPFSRLVGDLSILSTSQEPMVSQDRLGDYVRDWQRKYFVSEEVTRSGHRVYYLYPKIALGKAMLPLFFLVFFVFLLVAGLVFYLIFEQLKNYANQVQDILTTTSRIEGGQVYFRLNEQNKEDELKQITKAINAMLDGQQAAMRQVYQLQTKHAEAVLKALQAQVNPHFLYNTLEYIRMSAYVEGADSLAEFVYDFASLMRRNISSEKSATLAEEVQFIQTYIRLFQARYPGKLELDLMIDPETEDLILPKFTLQPLVENYLVHGIDFAEKGNRISIASHYEEGVWRLVIADNGRGIEQKRLDQLNRKIASVIQAPYALDQSASSIGLVLVAQRLSQYFGQETHMKLSTNEEGGVTTWICLRKK